MENIVTANELKTKGVARIDEITSKGRVGSISPARLPRLSPQAAWQLQ
jgi:hypothetical protein